MRYNIKKNEKISDIVNMFDIPYDIIRRFNPFVESKDRVYEGQVLTLPTKYTVQPGDTYESISKTHLVIQIYTDELNPDTAGQSVIYPGQTVFLPPIEY